ncbi:hypothetical protein BDZ97DRAFT_1921608 [Flammula alnicola]|nr:hypothetical protein BDZ97DRAFT_1921608 [Flammula alnicola]
MALIKSGKIVLESSSNYDSHKCSVSNGQPCGACVKLVELDAIIDHQLVDLVDLLEKRRALKTVINHHHNPLVHRLPCEIASHIFTLYVESVNDLFLSERPSNIADWSPPLLLASVCRTWREIALKIPRLWASANIFLYKSDLRGSQAELVKQWLDRSGQLPLSISLTMALPDHDQVQDQFFSRLFDVVRQYSHRWHSLTLYSDICDNHHIIGDLMQAPMLETIRLFPENYSSGSIFRLPETPSLRHFEISSNISVSNVVVQWDNLTYFEGYSNSPDEILTILYAAQRLVTGKFHCVDDTFNEEFPESAAHVTHTSLKHLDISSAHDLDNRHLCGLINLLDVPSLESFSFDSTLSPYFPKDEFISLFTRSQSPLVSLDIRAPANDHDLIDLLENADLMTDKFLNHLAAELPVTKVPLGFLPRLEILHFTGIRNFAWSSLLGILEGPVQDVDIRHPCLDSPIDNTTPAGVKRKRRLRCMRLTFTGNIKSFNTRPDDYINKDVLLSLMRIREAGVNVEILSKHGGVIWDLFQVSFLLNLDIRRPSTNTISNMPIKTIRERILLCRTRQESMTLSLCHIALGNLGQPFKLQDSSKPFFESNPATGPSVDTLVIATSGTRSKTRTSHNFWMQENRLSTFNVEQRLFHPDFLQFGNSFCEESTAVLQPDHYIDEDDMVREILMTLQGNRNIDRL